MILFWLRKVRNTWMVTTKMAFSVTIIAVTIIYGILPVLTGLCLETATLWISGENVAVRDKLVDWKAARFQWSTSFLSPQVKSPRDSHRCTRCGDAQQIANSIRKETRAVASGPCPNPCAYFLVALKTSYSSQLCGWYFTIIVKANIKICYVFVWRESLYFQIHLKHLWFVKTYEV